ncbi:MAG: DUF1156 domain-containing protein [Syntrophobacteraceae bacterium]
MRLAKKLIEVALPLDAINKASAREKSIRHGHPSTLHLWWARRPLAAARAVIFAQMVDDPSAHPDLFPTEKAQEKERQRLFKIIEDLVQWENTNNETVLQRARDEIWKSWRYTCAENAEHPMAKELFDRHRLPAFHDPFAGGGSLPLEAQRLGLEAYASDLNPVAVLICKAMLEIPPKFAGRAPVNPESRKQINLTDKWFGAQGLAEDVRYYGKWIRDEAEKRIGHLYPKVEITEEMAKDRQDLRKYVGHKLTVIAWFWARTVKSPNPAFAQVDVPLASSFMLSTKVGKEAYVQPIIGNDGYLFTVKVGAPNDIEAVKNGTKAGGSHSAFICLMSGTPMPFDYIRSEAKTGRMGVRLMAAVCEGHRSRVYVPPTTEMENIAYQANPMWKPDCVMPKKHRNFQPPVYGMDNLGDVFTHRQLVALTVLSDLVQETRQLVREDALKAGMADDGISLERDGARTTAYADAVGLYLGLAVSRTTNTINALTVWSQSRDQSVNLFSRQAIPMVWDFPEVNPFGGAAGDFSATTASMAKTLSVASDRSSWIFQADARTQNLSRSRIVSTDPPYYDNVAYADLSDFFYVWLRRSLKSVFPDLLSTLAVPKAEELVAMPHRHGSREKAEQFFMNGMTEAMHRLAEQAHPAFPVSIYYAFKQSEMRDTGDIVSTGWETFLDAVIRAGFNITGTWPIRTERPTGVKAGTNSLASSIVLVCRNHSDSSPSATRRDLVAALKAELPLALAHLQHGNIAPVDLAQAAIGPGMGVYTRYSKVLDATGRQLSVREALALINQTLDEALAEQEGDFDADSRWALAWFEQVGYNDSEFGVAEILSKAKNTSLEGMVGAGIVSSRAGKVRLLRPDELPANWDPEKEKRLTAWEMVHQLIRVLEADGEDAAAKMVAKLGARSEVARELAYRLYTICERKKRAAEALSYNSLVQSWPEILRLAQEEKRSAPVQGRMFER